MRHSCAHHCPATPSIEAARGGSSCHPRRVCTCRGPTLVFLWWIRLKGLYPAGFAERGKLVLVRIHLSPPTSLSQLGPPRTLSIIRRTHSRGPRLSRAARCSSSLLIWSSVSPWRGWVFMIFDWKSDRNEDVWEFERRISLGKVREWPGGPDEARGNRASPWRSSLTSGSLQRRKFLNSCGADRF